MSRKKAIAVFDIGKTNKKVLVFDEFLNVMHQEEKKLSCVLDSDGFESENIEELKNWIIECLSVLIQNTDYEIKGLNFSTYGASLIYLDIKGTRLTPLYNYLKSIPHSIKIELFNKYGGENNFCRATASPSLGLLLNSGIQILWLKRTQPELFAKVNSILHLPQYLSFLFTNQIVAEYTSIGCHTFLWDFEHDCYHQWLSDENITLPEPISNSTTKCIDFLGRKIEIGPGIHDSSSSVVPYILASREKFILISTGTWCININPFNHTPLTEGQLKNDCLNYFTIEKQPVKASRFFFGHIHDVNVKRLADWFNKEERDCAEIMADKSLIKSFFSNFKRHRIFFEKNIPADYKDKTVDLNQFNDFSEAYHRMMFDLMQYNIEAINQILNDEEDIKQIYISGGFARNEVFMYILSTFFGNRDVYTSEIDNASALGAAIVIWDVMEPERELTINLNLKRWNSITI